MYILLAGLALKAQPILNWQGSAGTTGPIRVNATYYDENNNLFIGGHFSGSVDLDFGPGQAILTAGGSYDGFIAKYSPLGDFQWARRISGTNGEQVNGLTVSAGIVYVTGFFEGTATFNAPNLSPQLISAGSGDIFLARYAADNGNVFTPYRIGGTGNDNALGVKADAAGNIYLHGAYGSANMNFSLLSGSTTITSSGGLDGYIAKYDASLNLQWVRSYGGGTGINDYVHDIAIDQNGFVYAVGEFGGTGSNFNNGVTLTTAGSIDGFVIKINAAGTTLWGRRNGANASNDIIRCIKTDNKGSLYIAGTFTGSTVNLNPNGTAINFTTQGGLDGFVAKLDTNLATASWIRQLGGPNLDNLSALAIDTLGNVYTTGSFSSTALFPVGTPSSSLTSTTGDDIYVSKLNNSGNFVWSHRNGGAGNDLGNAIHVSLNGNHVFVGGDLSSQLVIYKLGECHDAGAITGATQYCSTANTTYSITPVTGATSYVWTLPSSWSGTSTTNSITATPTTTGGIVSVRPVTSCGLGFPRQLSVVYAFDTIDKNLARHWMANANDQNRDRIANMQLTFTDVVKDTDRFGTPNAAYRITSKAGFISTGTGLPTGNTSISFWYFYQPTGGENTLLGSDQTVLPAGYPLLYIRNSDNRMFPYSNTGANIGSGTVVTPNQWHHIALVRNAGNFDLYLNGTLVQTGSNLAPANFVRIGNNNPSFLTQGATGKFDEIRIYNALLTASQIQLIINYGQPKQLNYYQPSCIGNIAQHSVDFSATGVSYQWFKNTQAVGSNSPTYSNTFNNGDTLIEVRVTNQCSFETYSRNYTVNQPSAVTLNETVCGSFQLGNKRYIRSGQYKDTLVNRFGCDSIITLNLTIDNSTAFNRNQGMIHYWPINSNNPLANYKSNLGINFFGTSYTNDREGNSNSAVSITNNSGRLEPASSIDNNQKTIVFWYRRSNTIEGTLLANGTNVVLSVTNLGQLRFNNGTATTQALNSTQWYQIAYTHTGNVVRVYVDGVEWIGTGTTVNPPITRIGSLSNNTFGGFGAYDDVMVFDYALTQSEINQLRNMPTLSSFNVLPTYSTHCNYTLNAGVKNGTESIIELYKNNQLLASDTFTTINNFSVNDTSIGIRIYKNCVRVDYYLPIKVYRQFDTIHAISCGSYSFNNKTYTASGKYLDTLRHFSGCESYIEVDATIEDIHGDKVSSNGLIRYWSANSVDGYTDLTNNASLSFVGSGIAYGIGRTGTNNTAFTMTGTSSLILTNIQPMSTGSISFWYFHSPSITTKKLLGSNASTSPEGNPLIVVVNNALNVWTNTGTGVSVGTLADFSWNHIVLVRSGSNYSFYLNGNLVSTGSNLSPANFDRIGNNRPGFETQGADGGRFDDIFIYNRLLTAQEVSILFNSMSMISYSRPVPLCGTGQNITVRSRFIPVSDTRYSIWRGSTKIADTSFATISNINFADTSSIVIRALKNCQLVEYPVNLTIYNQPVNLNANLLRFWTMKSTDNRNSLTNGSSPYSLNGTITTTGITGRSDLDSNGSVYITSKNDQWINTNLAFNELQNNQPYTISFWHRPWFINQGSSNEIGILLSHSNVSSVAPIQLANNNSIQVLNSTGTVIFNGPVLSNNVWNHIVYSNDRSGNYKLYLNGILLSQGANAPTWAPERIGNGRPGLTNRGTIGRYDDIAIYNKVITDAEALALYNLPAIISTPLGQSTCNSNTTHFAWVLVDTNSVNYTFIRNNSQSFNDSTSLTFLVTPVDTMVSLIIGKPCGTIRFNVPIIKNTNNLNNGLVRFWTMNARDNGRSLAATSHTALGTFERSEPLSMIYFDGRDGFSPQSALRIGNKTSFINPGTTGLTTTTVSFWYRPATVIGTELNRVLLSGTTSPSILIAEIVGSEIRLRPVGTNDNFLGTSFYTLAPNVFHHIVFVRNGTNYEIYVNDTLRLSGTGISQNNIGRIGNVHSNITVDRGALGTFDDIAIYSRAITRDEVSALFRLPTIYNIPDTSAMCAGSSRNFQFSLSGGGAIHRLEKSSPPLFNSITTINANGTSGTTTVNTGDRIALVQQVGCNIMQYNFYPNVQGSSSPGPALTYNANTRNISVSTSFNQIRLFRNGSLLFTNNSGNLNYTSPFRCGDYYAEYITTGNNCPQVSPTLQALPVDTFNRSATLCPSRSITFGTLTITSPGVYIQTYNGVVGNCDSTVRLTVSSGAHSSSSISRSGCGSITLFGTTYTTSGQYTATIPNAAGCDSVITMNLTITPGGPSINNISASECYSYTLNGKTYTQTGIFRDTLFGASSTGCDSILVINLTIKVSRVTLSSQTACKRYQFNNKLITASGTYRDTLTNVLGCDSIITITVTINNVDKNVTRTGNTLEATGAAITSYQWINCANNLPISGATSATYTATTTGDYAVILTGSNGCIDTSNCVNVTIAPCNVLVSQSILNPGASPRCKNVQALVSNATAPITYTISWTANPIGNTLTKNDTFHVYTNVCPETYKLVVTDDRGCSDSVSFTINEPPTSLSEQDVFGKIVAYPNPANRMITIQGLPNGATVSIYNTAGQIVYKQSKTADIIEINTNQWNAGIYLVRIQQEQKFKTIRIQIAH